MLAKKQILESPITNAPFTDVVQNIVEAAQNHESDYVCLANVHMLVEAWQDPAFQHVLNRAKIATPDGKPLAVAMNLLYGTQQAQISGTDLTLSLLDEAQKKELSVFF